MHDFVNFCYRAERWDTKPFLTANEGGLTKISEESWSTIRREGEAEEEGTYCSLAVTLIKTGSLK